MFPILPILILLFLGPANAERLAVEGRFPTAVLAAGLGRTAPACAATVAPEEASARIAERRTTQGSLAFAALAPRTRARAAVRENPGCPPRAGPRIA